MRLPDDDELYRVDQTYLGPPGRYIAAMRHKAIFAFLVIGPVSAVVLHKIGVPMTLLTVGLWLLGSVWAAMKVADHIGAETSAGALVATLWHELTAPRPTARGYASSAGRVFRRVSGPSRPWGRVLKRRARSGSGENACG